MGELYISIGFICAVVADILGYQSEAMYIIMLVIVVELKILIEEVKSR